ncbi:TatD family hydrolase [Candidatus Saccharibacteria bacterium]|nr:TatD family hydrolase [Candidatus Saccharibacteria bacterium]
MLIDTHCHIHESDFPLDQRQTLAASATADVRKLICVGTNMQSSREAVSFAKDFSVPEMQIFAAIGVHPHDSKDFSAKDLSELKKLIEENRQQIVAVGEIGLDYYYEFTPRAKQIEAFEMQLQLAIDHALPVSFHVRDDKEMTGEVWQDFWPIIDNFSGIKGVLHSFTDTLEQMDQALKRGLYIGVNGIATFNKKEYLIEVHKNLPLDRMLLETDAPFLAPVPFRGQKNQPSFIPKIVEFLNNLRGESFQEIAEQTTKNAEELFSI